MHILYRHDAYVSINKYKYYVNYVVLILLENKTPKPQQTTTNSFQSN